MKIMKTIKRILISALFVFTILVLGGVGAYLFISDEILISRVADMIEAATGTRVEYRKDAKMSRTLSPAIHFDDFILENEHFTIQSSSFKLQVSLPGLLSGKLEIPLLTLGDTRIELLKSDTPKEQTLAESFPFIPVLSNIKISKVSIIHANKEFLNLSKMNIKEFNIKAVPDADKLYCTLKIQAPGELFDITATLPRVQEILEAKQLPLSLDIKTRLSHLSTEGMIDFSVTPMTFEAGVKANATGLPPFLSDYLPPLKSMALSTKISGNNQNVTLKGCRLDIKTADLLDLNLLGQLDLKNRKTGLTPENIDMSLVFAGPTTRSARMLLFDDVPELGAINGKVKIHSKKGDPSLESIIVKTSDKDGIQVDLKGRIAKVPLDPDRSNSGYNLDVVMMSEKTSLMGERLGLHLPVEEPLNIAFKIQGDTQRLQFNKIDLSVKNDHGDYMKAAGHILCGDWDQIDPMENIDLALSMKSRNIKSLEPILEKQLPELGDIVARARLHTVSKLHRLNDIHIRIGETKPLKLKFTGTASQVVLFPEPSLDNIRLWATASGSDTALLTDLFSLETTIPSMGDFRANATIIGNSEKFCAKDISFKTRFRDKGKTVINLGITGQFEDFDKIDTLSLTTRLNGPNLKKIGAFFDQKWPAIGPVKLNSVMTKQNEKLLFTSTMSVDKIKIKATNTVFFLNTPLQVNGKVQVENFFFPDLADFKDTDNSDEKDDSPYFFSRESIDFGWLKKIDVDLSFDIKSFEKERSRFESAYFKIDLESGHLSVRPARLNFPQGKLEFDLLFNMENKSRLNIKAIGENINPYQALSMEQAKTKDDFDADIDVDIALTAMGKSEHELISNMDGDIYMVIKNGKVRTELADMLFVDLIGWTFKKTIGDKYADINCGVIDFNIKKGVLATDAFFIDTEDITIAGEGIVNLAQEQIDYVFLPKKKSRLITSAEPVKIKGSLSDPSITVLPWKSAITQYGSLIFSPYLFAGQVVVGLIKDMITQNEGASPCEDYEKKKAQERKKSE